MKFSYFVLSVSLAHKVVSTGAPTGYKDPESAKDCVEWYNHELEESCEKVRDYFAITPEQFHQWNPSLGLDCKPWNDFQSYCIVTQERLDNTPKSSTSSSEISTTTTTSSTLAPSPTAWTDKGCYVETPKSPVLQQNMFPKGDTFMSVGKCQDVCYRGAFNIAGVQEGNQCWCGTFIAGEWASSKTECDIPCSGDDSVICGGTERLNIFLAEDMETPSSARNSSSTTSTAALPSGTATTSDAPASSTTSGEGASTTKTSGAQRNKVMFWQNW